MKTKKWKLKLTSVLIGLIIGLIIMEIMLRLFFRISERDISIYRPSFYYSNQSNGIDRHRFKAYPFLPYSPLENDSRRMINYRPDIKQYVISDYTTNSLGFRTPETTFDKPANVKRIITLGGSTTWDGPTNDSTWPALLEVKLNKNYKNSPYRIEVINLAVDGANSAMSYVILSMIGMMYEPDLVISYDGVNDFHLSKLWNDIIPDYRNRMMKLNDNIFSFQLFLPRWMFKSYFISVLTNFTDRVFLSPMNIDNQVLKETYLVSNNNTVPNTTILYKRNLKLMRGISTEYQCSFVGSIAHWVTLDKELNSFDSTMKVFFKNESINYLDLQDSLPHDDFSIHVDQVHWTTKGLQMISDEWMEKIVRENLLGIDSTSVSK